MSAALGAQAGLAPRGFFTVRPVFYLTGGMLLALAGAMLLPMTLDLARGDEHWTVFAASSFVTFVCGVAILRVFRCELKAGLTLRQAFLLTPFAWTAMVIFAALPMYFSGYGQLSGSFTNSFFEAMSGLTTTGATIISGLDRAPPGLLLWRALLQWLGGIGIIATAIAILPTLGVGGMQLFRTESSDRSEKVLPRAREVALALMGVYVALTLACGIAYALAGMSAFDAVAHALTTVSTAGFSTSDKSLGHWDNPAIHWVAIVFMLSGAIPYVLYVQFLQGRTDPLRNSQARVLLGFVAAVVLIVTAILWLSGKYGLADAFRHGAFNVVSIVTTTGFASTDYTLWGNVATGLFFGLTFVGGCTGSTSGGMKIFRFEVMARMLRGHFLRLLYPRGVFMRTYAGRELPDDVVGSVVVFFSLFFACYSLLTIALMALDLDFLTSASAAAASLANVGPGLGPIIGPDGNFSSLPDTAKWLLCFAMLLGRLELFTVLILFMPQFWRG
ncbi:MAG: TrkH family potassium uptake protein [Beijerinckiaceae bacterium]|nr:TrkH family potassium uptake protein [Beijerinckiaceae bacterium]